MKVRYLPYSEWAHHREALARFGNGIKGMSAISRDLA